MGTALHNEFEQPVHASPDSSSPPPPRPKSKRRLIGLALVVTAITGVGGFAYHEATTSSLQAQELSRYAAKLTYELAEGPSDAVHYPTQGPFDERLGYVRMPQLLERLQTRDFQIARQARFSPELLEYSERGFFPPYREKTLAGLSVQDCRAESLFDFSYPRQGYDRFESIPPLMVQALLFIENRELLDTQHPYVNPAVDWGRFTKAAVFQVAEMLGVDSPSMGGSTLATQIEKYRHSADGVTSSVKDKLQQMVSASVRAYHNGPETLAARQELVRAYLNTVPLSAAPGYGEVHGVGDGLRVWFGADFAEVNELLRDTLAQTHEEKETLFDDAVVPVLASDRLNRQGLALRQVLALMIAHRRPSYYLAQGRDELASLTDSYLRLMAKYGQISPELRDAGLAQKTQFRDFKKTPAVQPVESNKGINMARSRMATLLDVSLYDLDRFDLSARTTLQGDLQQAVSTYLKRLREPEFAREVGLFGERLLNASQVDELRYSFTLFERTSDGNQVRVQTDNTDQPFDINEGSKLELGSTAKLRVLATYLEVIAEIHQRHAGQPEEALRQIDPESQDLLTRWVLNYLLTAEDKSLPGILKAALERPYSASPAESFFTGGGMHTFNNFRPEDNGRVPTVRESLRESINLPFVRMLRDLVRYSMHQNLGSSAELLGNDQDPRRKEYLARFADREGLVFLHRFWRKYQGKDQAQRLDTLLDGLRLTAPRAAAVHRYLFPEAEQEEFGQFLRERLPNEKLSDNYVALLYKRYGLGAFNLPDQSYIARVHPLELWLLAHLRDNPESTLREASEASQTQRQEVYSWLFRTRAKNARDSRIRSMLEIEAFLDIHHRWKRLGYPFEQLVPSLATALGSSGDRPAALAELMGIIVNNGVRMPTIRIDRVHFAEGTPYEADLVRNPIEGEQVMLPEVAAALRDALTEVVNSGTARRMLGSFSLPDGSPMVLGGKTGTGDNRLVTLGAGGQRIASRALNRTATFVFYLGENHFGTLTAFVPGREAAGFRFTSALPVQVLKGMAPILQPYLEPGSHTQCDSAKPVMMAREDIL